MKSFLEFLQESIIDARHDGLAPAIFESGYARLKSQVRLQIQQGIHFLKAHGVNVLDYRLIGSILTHQYDDTSDLDINVLIEGDLSRAYRVLSVINGKKIVGTTYDLNFHLLNDRSSWTAANDDADGVFNVEQNKFEKTPIDLPFHVDQYWREFQRVTSTIDYLTGKIKGEIHSHDKLKSLPHKDLEVVRQLARNHLRNIQTTAIQLVDILNDIQGSRWNTFSKSLSPEDIMRYGAKNKTPANVLYKLLEKYHYLHLLHAIAKVLGPEKKITPKELNELRRVFS